MNRSLLASLLVLAATASAPATAQAVSATVNAATQLRVTAVTNTDTRPVGFNLTNGLALSANYFQVAFQVQVDASFGLVNNTGTGGTIVYTVNEVVTGFGLSPTTAGPHATVLQLASPQTRTGTLRVTFSGSGTASVDLGNDSSTEWTQANGSPWQQQVAIVGTLPIRLATSLSSSSHALTVTFIPDPPLAQLPLANPGFENGLIGWNSFGNAFAEAANPPNIEPRTGNSVGKMYGMFSGGFNVSGFYQEFMAAAGETYVLDCHARHWSSDALTGGGAPNANWAEKKIEFFDASGTMIGHVEQLALDGTMPTDTWVHTPTVFATAPAGTVTVRAVLLFLQPGLAGGAAHFDDVAFARQDGCGAFTLTTGVNGGPQNATHACFTVDVTAAHGVRICGIDVFGVVWNNSYQATLLRHRTLTDHTQLTAATNRPEDWCEVATLSVPVGGTNVLHEMALANATDSLDLPSGQHLLAIRGAPQAFFLISNTPNTTRTVSDPGVNLTFHGGLVIDSFGNLLPNCIDCTLHYEVATAPVLPSPCKATVEVVGTSCGSEANMVYEQFTAGNPWDLTGFDVILRATGSGAMLRTAPGTPIVPAVGPNLGLYADSASPRIPLGFDLAAFGLPQVTDISVAFHGSIFLGGVGNTSGNESATTLGGETVPRVMALWNRYDAGYGETIHVDVNPGVETIVTFKNMNESIGLLVQTFQVVIRPNAMRIRFSPTAFFNDDGMVGFHNGVPFAPNARSQVDLTTRPTTATHPSARRELRLVGVTRPLLGTSFDVRLDDNPGTGVLFAEIGTTGIPLPLPVPKYAAGCFQYLSDAAGLLGVSSAPSHTFRIPIPDDTSLLGQPVALQATTFENGVAMTSHALQAITSNF